MATSTSKKLGSMFSLFIEISSSLQGLIAPFMYTAVEQNSDNNNKYISSVFLCVIPNFMALYLGIMLN